MVDNESKRNGLAMRNATFPLALGLFVLVAAQGVQATQTVNPATNATGGTFAGGPNDWSVSRAGGQPLVFFGRYTSTNANESGLGLKIQYDATKITNVAIDQVLTKCMVFAPDIQVNGASSQVLFGWADTSQRTSGVVGWPGTADDPTHPCINPPPGIVTQTGAFPVPTNVFRFTATTAPGFTSGTSTITISPSSASSAGGAAAFTNTSLVVTGLAVAPCNLDIDGDGSRLAFKDGILLVRYMLGIRGAGLVQGLTLTGTRTDSTSIENFIAAQNYNVKGGSTAQQAFVDGVILVRLLLGVADGSLLNSITIPAGAAFTTAADIRANVNATCGTSF
jgi:hypothetical protein